MHPRNNDPRQQASPSPGSPLLSRRSLVGQLATLPLALRLSPLFASGPFSAGADPHLFTGLRFQPHDPVRSPLEDVLRLVAPGLDQFPTELQAAQVEALLAGWATQLQHGDHSRMGELLAPLAQLSPLSPTQETVLRDRQGIAAFTRNFAAPVPLSASAFAASVRGWLGAEARVLDAVFEVTSLDTSGPGPQTLQTTVRYSLNLGHADSSREQRVGLWLVTWAATRAGAEDPGWRITRLKATTESRTLNRGPGFVDVTSAALGANPSYTRQLLPGSDYWRTVLDGASGIDLYGNNGVAAGDYNNDGFDDLYLSQPAGLPNRLFRNRGDGTFEDVTEHAGVGVLDLTACALFADLRNLGLQDLLVVCGAGPLLFENRGDGTFQLKPDAFHFAQPPQGTFAHAAIADYDRDGRLDIYFCLYSYYLGLDQYHYPAPYFDARNGPPNFLMHNRGDGTFEDRTDAAGLRAENDRYSFACAWQENEGTHPDLYVVNDFGRNNLYRSRGDGTFTAVSEAVHVQDVGAGMSAAWGDTTGSGRADLYVANMWSAAGQRVSHLAAFHPESTPANRELYQRHARGNALYRAEAGGAFANVSAEAGVEVGRWAWGSDFLDFDHDGHADLYVTNGYISAPDSSGPDLGSFFWRQVVGRSPDTAAPSLAYEHGWNALNELIRTDSSWSGHERNVLFANNGDGTFTEASGPLGLDFLEDGRSFALADLDGDGRLEIVLKNRNGPQLRILHNQMPALGDSVLFRLRGTASNRDAIGTRIILRSGTLVQRRSLQSGSGFLAQHSKELLFGLGTGTGTVHAEVRWPSGTTQHFAGLPRNRRIELTEGDPVPRLTPFAATPWRTPATPAAEPPIPTTFGTWLLDPLPAPAFSLPDRSGTPVALERYRGRPVLLHLFTSAQPPAQLQQLDALSPDRLAILALLLDGPAPQAPLRLPVLRATPELAGIYNLIFRYLYDRRANLPLPTSFLLDPQGMIVKVYQGPVAPAGLLADVQQIPTTPEARQSLALPFPGTLHLGTFRRNSFTYGVAMFQHGYLDQAAASFEQVIGTQPNDAEAHYNLGTLNLRRNRFPEARTQLQTTLKLKPNYPEAWNNLGMIAAREDRGSEALASFRQAITLRPDYPTALLNLGNLLRHEGQYPEAETALRRALALAPDDPEASYSLGMLFAQQGQFPSAEQYLRQAIALRPSYPEALNNLGVLYIRQGDNSRAEQQFLTARQLAPSYEPTYLNLARLYLSQGDRAKARQSVEDLLKQNPASAPGKEALQALGPT